MSADPTTSPPATDTFVWFREDRIMEALSSALTEAVETHGDPAKSVAWDVSSSFNRILREVRAQ